MDWKAKRVSADMGMERIRPGMRVFLSTGAAEPRTLVNHLMAAHHYLDQICLPESVHRYPSQINECQRFKGAVEIRLGPIRPSDEEEMRRLFYRFSDEAVYCRYFSSLKAMPHTRMQTYVNVDWNQVMSIVGLVGKPGEGTIVSEARYPVEPAGAWAEIALIVDDPYQNSGISTYLFHFTLPDR